MAGQPDFFDLDARYRALSAAGDALERLARAVDFELFRPELEAALGRSDRAKGGRPPDDAVLMFKVLVLQTLYTLSDDQTEYQLRDRLSFMRFVGLALRQGLSRFQPIDLGQNPISLGFLRLHCLGVSSNALSPELPRMFTGSTIATASPTGSGLGEPGVTLVGAAIAMKSPK